MMNIVKNLEQLQRIDVTFDNMMCNSDGDPLFELGHYAICFLFHPDDISEEEVRKIANEVDSRYLLDCAKSGHSFDSRFIIMHVNTFESFKNLLKRER